MVGANIGAGVTGGKQIGCGLQPFIKLWSTHFIQDNTSVFCCGWDGGACAGL